MRNRSYIRNMIVILIIVQFILTGCVKKSVDENSGIYGSMTELTPKIQGSISLFTTNIDTYNPLATKNYYTQAFLGIAFEGLVSKQSNQNPTPVLAESWTSTNLNKQWNFKLKQGVKWHKNTTFTGNDVIETVDYLRSSQYHGSYQSLLKNVIKVTKTNAYTISFFLNHSDPVFVSKMFFPILSSRDLKNHTVSKTYKPNGTGPYKFRIAKDHRIRFDRFSNWHMKQALFQKYNQYPPFIKTIEVKEYHSPKAALGGFLRGEIDLYPASNDMQIQTLKAGYNVFETITNRFDLLVLNPADENLKNLDLRKAISLLVNKNSIVKNYFNNDAIVLDFPNLYSNRLGSSFEFNQNKGEALLSKIKWNTGKSIELLVNIENPERLKIAEELKNDLLASGVRIKIKQVSMEALSNALNNQKFQIAFTGFSAPTTPDFRFAFNYYHDKKYNQLVKAWLIDTNPTSRNDKYDEIVRYVGEQTPIIGLYNFKTNILCNRKILGTLSSDPRFPYNNIAECSVSY
ncbi:MAG: ABC transporter substrate-binding protein [Clostridia bacterium]